MTDGEIEAALLRALDARWPGFIERLTVAVQGADSYRDEVRIGLWLRDGQHTVVTMTALDVLSLDQDAFIHRLMEKVRGRVAQAPDPCVSTRLRPSGAARGHRAWRRRGSSSRRRGPG